MLDKAEEKAEFDRVLEQTVREAAAQKAVADKALLDMGEMEVGARVAVTTACWCTIVPCNKAHAWRHPVLPWALLHASRRCNVGFGRLLSAAYRVLVTATCGYPRPPL